MKTISVCPEWNVPVNIDDNKIIDQAEYDQALELINLNKCTVSSHPCDTDPCFTCKNHAMKEHIEKTYTKSIADDMMIPNSTAGKTRELKTFIDDIQIINNMIIDSTIATSDVI